MIGCVMILSAIVLGLWAGVWWAFIGGIVDVIEQVRAPEMSAIAIAIGVAKVVFAGFIGWLAFAVLAIPGKLLILSD
ncbi:hypothetical protein LF41_2412 [Lysobacter dokdonensis DS-58]|uniref:Transmembrane protein n=1 Tax=Lysobacter dokdonensis DS-58 TaxID=1300345 RepID=A0A0A2WNN6_9GAMM|nr:hypothetical protein LF41_2412 [Lysobacter dokdonensis DS-58]